MLQNRISLFLAFCLFSLTIFVMNVSASTHNDPDLVFEPSSYPQTVTISADGEYFAVGTGSFHSKAGALFLFEKDNDIPLWNYTNENCVSPGSEPPFSYCIIKHVSISANGDYIVIGSKDHNISLFGKESNIPLWTYKVEGYEITSISISASGDYIFATSRDDNYTSFFFSKESNVPLWTCDYSCLGDWIETSVMSDDGEYIVVSTESKRIHLFSKDSNTPLWNYSVGRFVSVMDISGDGEYLVIGASILGEPNATLSLFGKENNTPLWEANITVNEGGIGQIAISSDGSHIALGSINYTSADTNGFKNNNIHFFGKNSNIPLWTYNIGEDCYCMALAIAISVDGEYIAVGTDNDSLHMFNKESNIPIWSYITNEIFGQPVVSVGISEDNKYVVAAAPNLGSMDSFGQIYLFDNERIIEENNEEKSNETSEEEESGFCPAEITDENKDIVDDACVVPTDGTEESKSEEDKEILPSSSFFASICIVAMIAFRRR